MLPDMPPGEKRGVDGVGPRFAGAHRTEGMLGLGTPARSGKIQPQ